MRARKLARFAVPLMLLWLMLAVASAESASDPAPKYDTTKEVTIKGVVQEVKEVPNPQGQIGIYLMVKSGEETIEVRLCPNSFLKEFEVVFHNGDELTITGSKVKVGEKEVILARVIESGNNKITLRDPKGVPVWTWLTKGGMK